MVTILLTLGVVAAFFLAVIALVRWIDYAVTTTLVLLALGVVALPAWGLGRTLGWWG